VGVPLSCTVTNKQVPPTSSLAEQKLDATTNLPVTGATFQLYREMVTVGRATFPASAGAPITVSGVEGQLITLPTTPNHHGSGATLPTPACRPGSCSGWRADCSAVARCC
jgi:hypothetical protein